MKEILNFLRDLEKNNNRIWFNTNKERYQKVLKKWNAFCESLITEIGRFDADIAPLTIKDCTYRIYRDTRFSKDKSPYKTHFGVFMAGGERFGGFEQFGHTLSKIIFKQVVVIGFDSQTIGFHSHPICVWRIRVVFSWYAL